MLLIGLPGGDRTRKNPHFKCGPYTSSDTGSSWYLRPDSNREKDVSETPAYTASATKIYGHVCGI